MRLNPYSVRAAKCGVNNRLGASHSGCRAGNARRASGNRLAPGAAYDPGSRARTRVAHGRAAVTRVTFDGRSAHLPRVARIRARGRSRAAGVGGWHFRVGRWRRRLLVHGGGGSCRVERGGSKATRFSAAPGHPGGWGGAEGWLDADRRRGRSRCTRGPDPARSRSSLLTTITRGSEAPSQSSLTCSVPTCTPSAAEMTRAAQPAALMAIRVSA